MTGRQQLRSDRARARQSPLLALAEWLGRRDPQRYGLAGDDVLERAALLAREDGGVDSLGELLAAQDHAAAGSADGLVDRGGDYVCIRHRVGVQARGDEPGEVGHVDDEVGADVVGDRSEALE